VAKEIKLAKLEMEEPKGDEEEDN